MLNFGIEVGIDREERVSVKVKVFKFLIEDVQKDQYISPAFRVNHLPLIFR